MGFTDDIIVRVTPASSGSRIDLRSSSRYGRSDFGVARAEDVPAAIARAYYTAMQPPRGPPFRRVHCHQHRDGKHRCGPASAPGPQDAKAG
jgi:hypothetical protein